MKSCRILPVIFLPLIFVFVSGCKTYIKIPIASSMPVNFMKTMQGGKKIGVIFNTASASIDPGLSTVIQSSAEKKITEYRYFTIVDISRREERLKEVIFSQSGLTKNVMEFGNELAINGLIYLDVPKSPVTSCVTTSKKERRQGDCKKYQTTGTSKTCSRYENNRCVTYKETPVTKCVEYDYYYVDVFESTRSTVVFLKGELMNVQTGAKLSYTNTRSFENSISGKECSSEQYSFDQATELAANNVIGNLSPLITDLSVRIESDPAGSPKIKRKLVKSYLKLGEESLKTNPPDFEDASRQWQKALSESSYKSLYAYWNLALYSWYSGDLDATEKYFLKASDIGGPDFLKGGKKMGMFGRNRKDNIALFRKEKERLLIEERAAGR